MYSKIKYKNIEVSYLWQLNGGGLLSAHEFVHIISRKIGKVEHIFEYCAGPGFIGFCLLANNLCDKLTLSDVNPKAIAAIQETIKNNNLQDRVRVYQSDCLESIPQGEQWDLVVGNSPWSLVSTGRKDIMLCDPQGRVHEEFYRNVNKFLKPNGKVLFIEGGEYTNAAYFKEMTENNGLSITALYRVVSLPDIIKHLDEYTGLNMAMAFYLRMGLFFCEAYFVSSEKKPGEVRGPSGPEVYPKGEIIQIARKQKYFCWLFLGLWAVFLLPALMGRALILVFSFWTLFKAFHLVLALKMKRPFIYLIGMAVPVVNVFVALYLIRLSTQILKANKMNVGLMGAKNIPLDEKVVAL